MPEQSDIVIFTENQEIHEFFKNILQTENHFIHFAFKDESGLKKLSSSRFDLIIVEISQPLFSEITYIEQIHSLVSTTPILILSEYFGETKNTVFGNKVSEFVSKPFTIEKLLNSINSVLNPATPENKKHEVFSEGLESKRLSVLYEMSKSLNSITDFNLLLKTIINLATDALNSERATIFIYDRVNNEIWSRVGTGLKLQEIRFPITKGIAGEVISSGYSIITDNPYNHPAFNKEFDIRSGYKTRNLICVPMKNLKGILVGAFQVLNKREDRFTTQDEIFLSAMAASTAIAIENTLLHEENINKYNEIVKIYDELYTAQNMIVRESKQSIVSEMRGYVRELKQYDPFFKIMDQMREKENIPQRFMELLEKLENYHKNLFTSIGGYMNQLLNNIVENKDND